MANELAAYYPTPSLATVYFVVGQAGNRRYNTSGSPAFETTNTAHWPQYAIAGTDAGAVGDYEATFPAGIAAGTAVRVRGYLKAGSSPAPADLVIAGPDDYIWNGSSLVRPADNVASNGIRVGAANGKIKAVATSPVGFTLDDNDPLLPSSPNLQGYTVTILGKGIYGVITDSGTTAARTVTWYGGTPSVGDAYATEAPPILAAAGLDRILIESGINARQALSPILAASAGVIAGAGGSSITIKAGANASTTRIVAATDGSGNRTSVTLTLPS